tara:strand:- start:375 stop:692 length:318 start_codon:yes stop_codon:yes gene_type:complete
MSKECKHCAMESHTCDYCCDGSQIEFLETQLAEKDAEIERLKESFNIEIGDFIMVDDEMRFVTGIISDPNLKVFYYIEDVEYFAVETQIDCHFVNMNRVKEDLEQ